MSSMLSASRRKSSSSMIVSANSSTSAGGLASAATGMRPTRNGASQAITLRSACTSVATDGRCTLTTTSSPVTQRGRVHLGDRGGGQRRRGRTRRTPPRAGGPARPRPPRARPRPGLGRHLVAALLELADQLLGEHALADGDDLAELDVGRARGARRRCAGAGRCRPWTRVPPRRRAPTAHRPTAAPEVAATRTARVPPGQPAGPGQLGHLAAHHPAGDRGPRDATSWPSGRRSRADRR